MLEPNTESTVVEVMLRLGDSGAHCLLFGGWAEEAFALCQPRPHADIDLLLPAPSFQTLDHLLAAEPGDLQEISLKRFAHKRAFLFNGLMVEVVLVQQETWSKSCWSSRRMEWHSPGSGVTCGSSGLRL
jgi:hypothetical protein